MYNKRSEGRARGRVSVRRRNLVVRCVCDWMCAEYQGRCGRERANRLVLGERVCCVRVCLLWVWVRNVDRWWWVWIITFARAVSHVF
jgi:hypothetical protein